MAKKLSKRQKIWLDFQQTQVLMAEKNYNVDSYVNYSAQLHNDIIILARAGFTNQTIAHKLGLTNAKLTSFMKRFPLLKQDLQQARSTLIEEAHIKAGTGKQIVTECSKKYAHIKVEDKKTGKIRRKRVIVSEQITEKQVPINTQSLDRLSQKYAPEFAPKESREVEVNINVKPIDFSKLENAIEMDKVIDLSSLDYSINGEESEMVEASLEELI